MKVTYRVVVAEDRVPNTLRRSLCLLAVLLPLRFFASGVPSSSAEEPERGAPAASSPAPARAVTAVGVARGEAGTEVTIAGDGELAYEYFLIEGRSLVIDIPGAASSVRPADQQVDDEYVSRVQVAEQGGARPGVRVVIDLKRPVGFTVRGDGSRIAVAFPAAGAAPLPAAAAAPVPAAGQGPLNRVADVVGTRLPGVFRVAVKTDAPPAHRVLASADPRKLTVAVDDARLDPAVRPTTEYTGPNALVTRVSAAAASVPRASVLITVELREPAPFRVFADASGLNVDVTTDVPRPAPAPAPAAVRHTPASAPPEAPTRGPEQRSPGYAGSKITLDFVDADITDIFRLIADVSGTNIVTSDDVKGRRNVKMTEVPWDQALDLILKTNIPQLVKTVEADNVISITTLKRTLEDQAAVEKLRYDQLRRTAEEQRLGFEQAEALRKLEADSQAQILSKVQGERLRSKGWRERTFTISYGDTKEVGDRLKKFASGCPDGCIFEVGERSKTIFVRDFADNVAQMDAVLRVLEAPTPAVMVEARIVEVQSDYSRSLGIQWGANLIADAAHGNATEFAFPNSISVGGTAVEGPDGVNPGSYLVNLPATNAVAGVGLSLGHIANTVSLDMKLSALELMGRSKVLSNPKVLVVQNEEANINIGSQLPVPKTDAEGNRTIEWKDVGILLQVTPNVTSDGRVFMKIKIEKSAAGETVRTTEGDMFSIERRGAVTKVLVGDGETSVIGGIFQQTDASSDDGVPGLSKLPLVGWLFKSQSVTNGRKELLIFLTPRITSDTRSRDVEPAAAATAPPRLFGTATVLDAKLAAGGRVETSVEYVNDTAFAFPVSVSVNCRAFAADGRVVGGEVAHIWSREHGPIVPGFRLRLEQLIAISAPEYAAVRCEAVKAE